MTQPSQGPAILFAVSEGVATITLNRPERRNAIDDAMRADLASAFDAATRDPAVRAVVLTGSGRGFCSGGDLQAMKDRMGQPASDLAINGWRRQQRTHHVVMALHSMEKPTIAAVNGAATGLGCDLALCCDFIVASDQASFAMSYVRRGLIPDGGGLYFLPRRVGLSRAKELIFTGRDVSPEEAHGIGMIDRVVPHDQLLGEAAAWATKLASGASASIALTKSILDQTFELTLEQVFALGSQAQAICYTTAEHHDSVAAFLAKSSSRKG